jgi:hypothetical protein
MKKRECGKGTSEVFSDKRSVAFKNCHCYTDPREFMAMPQLGDEITSDVTTM